MEVTKMTAGARHAETLLRERNPRALALALRLMDAAAELDATAPEFERAVQYIRDWTAETQRLQPLPIAVVKRNRDDAVKELDEL